jgi:hypothetical protein
LCCVLLMNWSSVVASLSLANTLPTSSALLYCLVVVVVCVVVVVRWDAFTTLEGDMHHTVGGGVGCGCSGWCE